MLDLEQLKALNDIADIVDEAGEEFRLDRSGRGHSYRGVRHDSLVVTPSRGLYFWNSRNRGGSVIDFLVNEAGMEMRQAIEHLARRAGVDLDQLAPIDVEALKATRARLDVLATIAAHTRARLLASEGGMAYCAGRGWDRDAVEKSGLGLWDGDKKGLMDHLRVHGVEDLQHDSITAMLGAPANSLIYWHLEGGRPAYFSCRSIVGKVHYNPPERFMGKRRPYWNNVDDQRANLVMVVEGQADAVTGGIWGLPTVAMAGTTPADELVADLKRRGRVYIAADTDSAGTNAALKLAEQLGPLAYLVRWPAHDANDWGKQGATGQDARELLSQSITYIQYRASQVRLADPLETAADRQAPQDPLATRDLRQAAVTLTLQLSDYDFAEMRGDLARRMGIRVAQLAALRRALQREAKSESDGESRKEERYVAHYHDDAGHIAELLYQPANDHRAARTMLAVRFPDGSMREVHQLETETAIIRPIPVTHKMIAKGTAIILPSAIDVPESESALVERIRKFIHRWVDVPEQFEMFATYYVLLSWMFDKFTKLPYLRARGQSGSGKSRLNEVLLSVSFRAVAGSGISSTSGFFRLNDEMCGVTLVVDEADLGHTETSAEWHAILNLGYQSKFNILRSEYNPESGGWEPAPFSPFGPKIINMRGRFRDDATENRCYTLETAAGKRVRPDVYLVIIGPDAEAFDQEAEAIRNQLLAWRLRKFHTLVPTYDHELAQRFAASGRLIEISTPLLCLSADDPAFHANVLSFLEAENERLTLERGSTIPAKVLEAILLAWHQPDDEARKLESEMYTKRFGVVNDARAAREEALEFRLTVGHITRQLNRLLDEENLTEAGAGEGRKYKPHVVGRKIGDDLNLYKRGGRFGKRGTVIPWLEKDNAERIDALVRRYGLVDRWTQIIEEAEAENKNPFDGVTV